MHVTLAGQLAGKTYRGKHSYPCPSDAAIADMKAGDFHGVVCAGGWMPDKIRRDPQALALVRTFAESRKLVAAICHGGWIPISAGVYSGVKVTGSPGIKDDLVNAGAIWEDAPLVVDRHFVSSRKPADLPEFIWQAGYAFYRRPWRRRLLKVGQRLLGDCLLRHVVGGTARDWRSRCHGVTPWKSLDIEVHRKMRRRTRWHRFGWRGLKMPTLPRLTFIFQKTVKSS